jgi:hypothetical protein
MEELNYLTKNKWNEEFKRDFNKDFLIEIKKDNKFKKNYYLNNKNKYY